MIVTEERARKLVCPERPPIDDRTSPAKYPVNCLGSSCMWWEWVDPTLYLTTETAKWMPDAYLSADLEAPTGWCGRGQGR
jgi:hypothetical protein